MIPLLVRITPTAVRLFKVALVLAPHALTIYRQLQTSIKKKP